MKTFLKMFVFTVIIWSVCQVLPAGDIRLADAVAQGIQRDARFKNSELDRDISGKELEKALNSRWFNLSVNGSYLFKSEQMEIKTPLFSTVAGEKHNFDLNLTLVQPVYTGNRISNSIQLEKLRAGSKKYDTNLRRLEISGKIKASYFNYHLMEKKIKSLGLLIDTLELHRKRLNDLYQEEQVRQSDVLETEIKMTNAQMDVETLQQAIEEEKIYFTRLTGLDIKDIEDNYLETSITFPESFEYFLSQHPALKLLDSSVLQLEVQKKIVSGAYLPQVNSFAELHYGKPGIDFFASQWGVYFQGGISVSMKCFDWNKKKRDHAQLDFSIDKIKNTREDLVTETEKSLKQLYAHLQSIQKQLTLAKQLAETASHDAQLKEELYRENQAPNTDYLAALLDKERYDSLQQELLIRSQLLKLNINILIGKEEL